MLCVRDIMTSDVFSLPSDAPIEQAIWSFSAKEISGAPVRDPRGNLVGVLSKSDLVDPMRHELNEEATVADAMTPAVWAVHPDASVMDAVRLMVDKGIHRVLVVRGPGQLEGIVTSMSIMKALADGHDLGPIGDDDCIDAASNVRRARVSKL